MLYGSQKRFDKNGDGKLKGAEWQRWYQYAYGNEIEAKEKRRRANAAAEQKRAQIAADFADHVSDLINWMYRDLAHLEGEREDQAIRTMHLALYVISAALLTQTIDESMRYLLRAFWNEFQPTLDESVYQALCTKQVLFAEIGEISEKRLGSFWRNLLDNLPPERRIGKDDDLQELLDDTSRLYNYFSSDSTPIIDFAKEIEPYWAAIRIQEESKEAEEAEEYDEDEEPEEESEPWTDFYEKTVPAGNGGGYYQFCKVQFKDGGSPYAYLTGGLPLAVGDFVLVPVGNRNAEKTGRVTDIFVCSAQDAPYPPEKAKFVLRKSEQTAFPEKKILQDEPAKVEKPHVTMQPISKELTDKQPAPKETASCEARVATEPAVFTLPPLPEREEPKKRGTWKIVACAVIAAVVLVAIFPMFQHTTDVPAQPATQQQPAAMQGSTETTTQGNNVSKEEKQLDKKQTGAAASSTTPKSNSLKDKYSGKLPVDGMPVSCLKYTSLGAPSKTEKCQFYDNMDVHRRYKILDWYNSEGQIVASCHSHQPKGETEEVIYAFTYHESPIGRPNSAPAWTLPSSSGSSNSGSIRNDYDSPEDLWEDNQDWYDDEDEAWDEWEND